MSPNNNSTHERPAAHQGRRDSLSLREIKRKKAGIKSPVDNNLTKSSRDYGNSLRVIPRELSGRPDSGPHRGFLLLPLNDGRRKDEPHYSTRASAALEVTHV